VILFVSDRLLTAVENVLNEERELDAIKTELGAVKHTVLTTDRIRRPEVEQLEKWIVNNVQYIKDEVSSVRPRYTSFFVSLSLSFSLSLSLSLSLFL
jgi:hypothetical protein